MSDMSVSVSKMPYRQQDWAEFLRQEAETNGQSGLQDAEVAKLIKAINTDNSWGITANEVRTYFTSLMKQASDDLTAANQAIQRLEGSSETLLMEMNAMGGIETYSKSERLDSWRQQRETASQRYDQLQAIYDAELGTDQEIFDDFRGADGSENHTTDWVYARTFKAMLED